MNNILEFVFAISVICFTLVILGVIANWLENWDRQETIKGKYDEGN